MTRRGPAVLAALLLAGAAPAADLDPSALLRNVFGEGGAETLAARGVLVLQGRKDARRAAAVHWKGLDALSKAASSCLALASAADALGHETAPSSADLGLGPCRALGADGLVTPALHALATALESRHEERWALAQAGAAPAPADRKNAFDTPWGKDLSVRKRADMLENPAPLAKGVFDDLLAGPRPDKDAAALLTAEAKARGAQAPDVLLDYDASHGAMSEELKAQLRRSLADERRRWAAEKARAIAADLLAKPAVKKELEDLRGVAKALAAKPDLAASLEAAFTRGPVGTSPPRLRSAGLHLQEPVRLGQYELGDEAVVSGAYWVDGLPEGESAEVEETLVLENERGFFAPEARAVRRRNGGPYVYERRVRIAETRPFAVRAIVSAGGPLVVERVEVPVAKDYELALAKESEAAGLRASCRLKDAEAAYAALAALVAEPAKVKPQYRGLMDRAKAGAEGAKSDAETIVKLEESLAAAREDSAPQKCKYETDRVDDAIRTAKKLPTGCDKDLPELHALRALIVKRAADQEWFLRASSDARSKRRSCDLEGARSRWSEALSALESDPGARCGKTLEEETKAKAEFAEAARELAWREQIDRDLAKAEAESAPAKRLELVRPVRSRLGALNADCLRSQARKADALAETAARALTAPPDEELAKRLPPDGSLATASSEIKAERSRRLEAATAAEKAAVEPAPPPKAPAAKPEASKAPAKDAPKPAAPAKKPAAKKKGAAQ